MYKLILIILIVISTSVNAQINSYPSFKSEVAASTELENLFSIVQSSSDDYNLLPELSNFNTLAQQGLDFMNPEYSIRNLRCEKVTEWSESVSEAFASYLKEKYKTDMNLLESERIETIISELKNRQSYFGIVQWEFEINGSSKFEKSIAIFDKRGDVLFDTKLIDFAVVSESVEIPESDNSSPNQSAVIVYQSTQTVSRSLTYSGLFGSWQLYYEARATAFVPPYITASTNDADYNYYTNHIQCYFRNPTGFPPSPPPYLFLYFGTGGVYTLAYANATPSISPITIIGGSDTTDTFNGGLYKVSGSNGQNWSFELDFSVNIPGGGIGITPISSISPLSLSRNSHNRINLENYVYNHNILFGDVRAVFYHGGNLDANFFKILTRSGSGEIGRINVTSRLRVGYLYQDIIGLWHAHLYPETTAGFNISVQYLRGDHVLQPTYKLTSTRYNIPINQIDTLKAKITNNSRAVKLIEGNISIDVSSLNSMLTLLSPATLPIGIIDTSASKEFKFVVRGNSNGIVTPQVNITEMGWESPVPPGIKINTIASIDTNIDVSPLIKSLTLTAPIQGFYNASTNSMARDTLRVYLRNAISPYAIADSAKAYLNTSGTAIFSFSKAVNFTQYFIQIKHRNSIETWSKTPQFFINSGLTFDFSTKNTQAYGDNLIQVDESPLRYAIYNGDVNQDGIIDSPDLSLVDNDTFNFVTGYIKTDVNGDNTADAVDLGIIDNNAFNFVGKITPP